MNMKKISIEAVVFFLGILGFIYVAMISDIYVSKRQVCSGKLGGLAIGIKKQIAAEGMISKSCWCDTLVKKYLVYKDYFTCPGANKNGGYAINKNVLNVNRFPPDVVVLFDSKSGWNQIGGKELLAPENHKGKGCNILFGNMEVRFIEVKDFDKLKWNADANSNQ